MYIRNELADGRGAWGTQCKALGCLLRVYVCVCVSGGLRSKDAQPLGVVVSLWQNLQKQIEEGNGHFWIHNICLSVWSPDCNEAESGPDGTDHVLTSVVGA